MDFLQSFLQYSVRPSRKCKPKVDESQQCLIYRDELNKKIAPIKVKKKVQFESNALPQRDRSKNSYGRGNDNGDIVRGTSSVNGDKCGIQVKVLMTKEEAARLLSKCKDGGLLEFKDVANALVQIPNNRVDVRGCLATDKKINDHLEELKLIL